MSDDADSCCGFCGIPLVAVTHRNGDNWCLDLEACIARRKLISESGGAYLLTPEGVTWIDPKEEAT